MATFQQILNFDGSKNPDDSSNGANPYGGLVENADGVVSGTTAGGGANGYGTVFEFQGSDISSLVEVTHTELSFTSADGANPYGGLIEDAAGDLFGTTTGGGANGYGTVFEILAPGQAGFFQQYPTVATFNGSNGANPYYGGLIEDAAGDLFGTTAGGGANGYGTVFEIPYGGALTTLATFNVRNGANPYGGLIEDAAGDLFGTTTGGGANGYGTVFEIVKTAGGYASTPTTLVTFNGSNGANPYAGLVADSQGDLFGTTAGGGANGLGTVFEIVKTAGGYASTPTTLVTFSGTKGNNSGGSAGANPYAGLTEDAAGDLFGTTTGGGANGYGTVFELYNGDDGYEFSTLLTFNGTNNGANPYGGLLADTNGDLFGTTAGGGANGLGTVFELSGTGFVPAFSTVSLQHDTGSSSTDNITSNDALTGSGVPNAVVHFSFGPYDPPSSNSITTANSSGIWMFTPSGLADGTYTVVVSETDATSLTSTASLTFTLDTKDAVAITSTGGFITNAAQTVTGNVTDPNLNLLNPNLENTSDLDTAAVGTTVTILDGTTVIGTTTVQADGTWTDSVTLTGDGTHTLTATDTDLAGNTGTSTAVTYTLPTSVSGNNDEWVLSNGQWEASVGPGSHPSGYNVAAIGDWTGDGTDGILWFNPTNGDTDEWQLSNTQWAGSVDLGTHPGNFQIAGAGNFFGNGIEDVLWTGTSGGRVQTDIWRLSSNGQWMASVSPGSHPGGYSVAATGDWTGNGTDGILWYNATTGDTDEWQLANGQWSASVDLGSHPGSGWTVAGVGDFFDNGRDDVLWTNSSGDSVQTDIWELGSNGQWINSVSPGSHPAGYQVAGVGDFTGAGTSDILWYNATTGDTDEWLINNGQWAGSIDLGSHPGNFQIAGTGNFVNGNSTSDILWHSSS